MIDAAGSRPRLRIAVVLVAAGLIQATFSLTQESGASGPDCSVGDGQAQVEIVTLAAANPDGVETAPLETGAVYDFVVRGTFTFNELGDLADGANLSVSGLRVAAKADGDHVYCLRLFGTGAPVELRIRDSHHADNGGALEIAIYRDE